jgi:pilus assembly protein CpaB
MTGLLVRRLAASLLLLYLVLTALFFLVHLAPGSPVNLFDDPRVPRAQIARLIEVYGLDRPLPEQYVRWLKAVARGDWGTSFLYGRPVVAVLAEAVPRTFLLGISALAVEYTAALLLGLAALLGTLAASDVAGRERALREKLGEPVPVVVAGADLPAGTRLRAGSLEVRQVPQRYAPAVAVGTVRELEGQRLAVAVAKGTDLTPGMLGGGEAQGAPVAPGERVAVIVAAGDARSIHPGGRVDVAVTRERSDTQGTARIQVQNVEVLTARPAEADKDLPRVQLSLRVTPDQAMMLAAAQRFAELQVLPRAPGDERRVSVRPVQAAELG